MNRRDVLKGAGGLGLAGVGVRASASVERGVTDTSVTIGQSAPFSGLSKSLGVEMNQGLRAAVASINKAGGINGRTIRLLQKDDHYEPLAAAENTRTLISEGVFAFVGNVGTPTSLAALEVADAYGVPFLGAFTGSDRLRSPFKRTVFNMRASYGDEAVQIVKQLRSFSDKARIGLFVQNDSYGQAVEVAVRRALELVGAPAPVAVGKVERNSTDVAAACDALAKAGVEGVALGTVYGACAPLQEGLRARNCYPMLASVSFIGTSNVCQLGNAAEGVAICQVMPFPMSGTTALTREYAAAMADAGFKDLTYGSLEGYVAAKVFANGLRHAGPAPTREKLIAALETHGPLDLGGFSVDFSPTNHNGSRFTELTVVGPNGRLMR